MKIVFISPHLDDAILSCGALIYILRKKAEIKIITIISKAGKNKLTKSAGAFLKASNYNNAENLFEDRKKEDKNICNYLKIEWKHMNFIDAAWRMSDNNQEIRMQEKIVMVLKKMTQKTSLIFCPIGIGGHEDHLLVRKISDLLPERKIIYYADYPYLMKNLIPKEFIREKKLREFYFKKDLHVKEKLIKFYRSQIKVIYKRGIMPILRERYYFKSENFRQYLHIFLK